MLCSVLFASLQPFTSYNIFLVYFGVYFPHPSHIYISIMGVDGYTPVQMGGYGCRRVRWGARDKNILKNGELAGLVTGPAGNWPGLGGSGPRAGFYKPREVIE